MGRIEDYNAFKENLNSQGPYSVAGKRIEQLLDADCFSESGAFFSDAGVITGSGTVDGRLVYVYSQYGPVNAAHAKKLAALYDAALTMGAPVLGILDSCGMDLENGLENMEAYGIIYRIMSDASGVIPQISIVLGECGGTAAIIPGLSDFVFMKEKDTKLYLQSPNTYDEAKGSTFASLVSPEYHEKVSGNAHFVCDSDISCLTEVKTLLSYLPSNNLDETPMIMLNDDINRETPALNNCVKPDDTPVDMAAIIKAVADNGEYMESAKNYGGSILTGFARFNGFTAGIVANRGPLCSDGMKKAVSFVTFCDAFNMPIVNLTDVKAYAFGIETDKESIRNASALIYAYTNATVPKVNIIVKNAVGSPYLIMGSVHTGADIVYAWHTAAISLIDSESAKKVLGVDINADPLEAGKQGYLDDIIEPAFTRKKLIHAIETLASKRVFKHAKKHGTIVF